MEGKKKFEVPPRENENSTPNPRVIDLIKF